MRPTHILILLIVLIVLFGAKRLPDVARSVGQSLKVFKKEVSELQEEDVAPAFPSASTTVAPAPGPAQPSVSAADHPAPDRPAAPTER